MYQIVLALISVFLSLPADASGLDLIIEKVESGLSSVLFIEIFHIPFIVLVLILSAIFYTLKFNFINIRLFKHSFSILTSPNDKKAAGEITHFQAFATAVAGSIGLGTVAGVAVAVSIGGPGAVMWMMIAGFLGMSSKFTEVTLGFKYRKKGNNNQHTFGGPFQYIKKGLIEIGLAKTGKILAFIYAIFLILASLFASIPFQANQTISVITGYYSVIDNNIWFCGGILTLLLATVLLGGVKRIANVASALVPIMAIIYILSAITIIIFNFDNIIPAFKLMISSMFNADSAAGGTFGAMVAGIRRAVFANEAGIGTSPIAHAATQEENPIKAGLVAMLEPCIDTMIICFLTGLIITITGTYDNVGAEGILMTREAFATVSDWFPIFLSLSVPFFAFSTMIAYSYYCEMGWLYIFKNRNTIIYCRLLVLLVVFLSTISSNFISLAKLGDMLFMCLAVPNLIAMLLLSNKVAQELRIYLTDLRNK